MANEFRIDMERLKRVVEERALEARAKRVALGPLPLAWFDAVESDDGAQVARLASSGFDVDAQDESKRSGVQIAVWRDCAVALRALVEAGAALKGAANNGSARCLRELAAAGLDVEERDAEGHRPLSRAARMNHPACVEALIDLGARIDAVDGDGNPPAIVAAQAGSPNALRVLLDAGCDIEAEDGYGSTALDLAEAHEGHSPLSASCASMLRAEPARRHALAEAKALDAASRGGRAPPRRSGSL